VELYEHPLIRSSQGFIGDTNLLDAELVAERGDRALVRLGAFTFELPRKGATAGPIKLAIRPEAIMCTPQNRCARVCGRILRMSYGGSNFEYTVETALGELFVIDHAKMQLLRRARKRGSVLSNTARASCRHGDAILSLNEPP